VQSHNGRLRIFPAVPDGWDVASFRKLRAEGALIVSATKKNGKVIYLSILSEKGGTVRLVNPFAGGDVQVRSDGGGPIRSYDGLLEFTVKPGGLVEFALR